MDDENAKLFMRGVKEGYNGELLGASDMQDILTEHVEDVLCSYLAGVLEGEDDAAEDEADLLEGDREDGD